MNCYKGHNVLTPKSDDEIRSRMGHMSTYDIYTSCLDSKNIDGINFVIKDRGIPHYIVSLLLDFAIKNINKPKANDILLKVLNQKIEPLIIFNSIKLALEEEKFNIVDILMIHPNFDPTFNKNWLLRKSSGLGLYSIVKTLLEYDNVDPTEGNNEALRAAKIYNHKEIEKLLLADNRIK